MVTLKVLQRPIAQVKESVNRTTITCVLHIYGLYRRLARRKSLLKKAIRTTICSLKQAMWGTQHGRMCPGDMRPKLNFWPNCKITCTLPWTHHTHCETWWWQHYAVGILFFSRDREAGQNWWEDECSQMQSNFGRKPVRVCKTLETGLKIHFSSGQRP